MFNQPDLAKLLLRLSTGGLMMTHGVHKIIHGIGGIKGMVANAGLPEIMAYGVYVGELVAPLFIILGLYARVAAAVMAVNMVVAIWLAFGFSLAINEYGGLLIELPLMFMIMSLLIVLLGSGKYALNAK